MLKTKYFESAFHDVIVRGIALRLWKIIDCKWDASLCMALLRRLGAVFKSGVAFAFFVRRPVLDRALKQSKLAAALMWCANIVPMLLGKLNRRFPKLLNGSLVWSALEKLTLPVLCAMLLFMFVMPQEHWNNMYSLAFAVMALLLFWLSGVRDESRRLSLQGLGGWTVVFFAITLASTFWSLDFGTSIRYMAFWITSFIVIMVLVSLVRNERQLIAVVICMAIGMLIASGYAVMQRAGGLEASAVLSDMKLNSGMPGRVYSFFENPNSFANVLVLFAPVMLTMGLDKHHKVRSAFFLFVFLVGALALVMTYSRGGWIAIALSMFTLILIAEPKYAPLLIVVGCAALPILPENIVNRIITIFTGDSSISTRMYLYDGAFGAIASSPIIGVGLGSEVTGIAATASGRYLLAETMPFVHSHNLYFEIWAETGVVGLVAFLFAMFYALQKTGRAARNKSASKTARCISAGMMAAFVGSLFFGVTDYPWCYPRVLVMFWFAFALMLAAVKLCENQDSVKEN